MNLLGFALSSLALLAAAPRRTFTIVVDTYEGNDTAPVVTHAFHGKDPAQADAFRRAHLKYDSFFAGCERGGFATPGGSFPCRNVVRSRGWR